jgi:hypothetical protein
MIVPLIGGKSYSTSEPKNEKKTGWTMPRFNKYSTLGLFLLLISYSLSWWGFVILANIAAASGPKDSVSPTRVLKPTYVQLLGLLPALIIAALAFANYLFIVGGVEDR